MRRKLAAILAGDVVGFSRMMARDETATYRDLRSLFDDIVDPAVARNQGRIFKQTGDGFLASFASAHEALEAAEQIQLALASCRFDLRIGVNVGDVIEENDDTYGNSVNVAARLESMARPGSIYVSDAVRRSAEPSANWAFRSLGRKVAKNMSVGIDVYEVVAAGTVGNRPRSPWQRLPTQRSMVMTAAAAVVLAVLSAGAMGNLGRGARWIAELPSRGERTADGIASVAALPFATLGGRTGHAYLADRLSEYLIAGPARRSEPAGEARDPTFAMGNPADIRNSDRALPSGVFLGRQCPGAGSAAAHLRSPDCCRTRDGAPGTTL
ncbi:adenylate/guanylate cyclase domain-containing protein (plasmid) [Skermanella rosea]|uniref:adenylate/guanylate cyclase domain-containing protein n=1 Tax=Skermanella rosea TaxID=1817965 RepID=UPI001932B100|nr:adenylate/guanylate cyclase domain-containing protein [Skermanella rosea]UEM07536.1 adenylate/guanylate cyclase domain-containing protein [Skermanella rosea]